MSITDEMREHIESDCVHCGGRKDLLDIADRIDAEHRKALHDAIRNALANGVKSCLRQIADTHMPLPKDADGEYIHIGDVMDGIDQYDSHSEVSGEVAAIHFDAMMGDLKVETNVGVRVWDEKREYSHISFLNPHASVYRHHHSPTVEDVLRGVVTLCHNTWKEGSAFEFYDVDDVMNSGNIADFAAKLQLREGA